MMNKGIEVKENKNVIMDKKVLRKISKSYELYLFLLPTLVFFIVFNYIPMYGVQIAFKEFIPSKGIWGSSWIGIEHFMRFFSTYNFWTLIKNTLGLSLYELIAGFPIPIVLALLINQLEGNRFKKVVQTVTYAPHFISSVILVGIMISLLSPSTGIVNNIIGLFGGKPIEFMTEPALFKTIYVMSGIWQNAGWASIIYIAALSSISPDLHEAAVVDGANKVQRILHIDIPGILPTAIILLILRLGHLMNLGFEKVFLMQNPMNMETADVISTYVYRSGLLGAQYSFATAVGLFNAVINFSLLIMVNRIARKVSETSLW